MTLAMTTAIAPAAADGTRVPEIPVAAETLRLEVEDRNDIPFMRLSRSQGLSQQRVTHIVQDSQGFMWFGTQYGLNRYDGYRYRVFKHDRSDPDSLCGVFISALFRDRSGAIWVGCDYSLDRYDSETESFVHYRVDPDLPLDRASAVRHISQDASGDLWLATGNGLYRLEPVSGRAVRFAAGGDPVSLGSNDVRFSGEDRDGRFWVATSRGLEQFDRGAGRVTLRLPLYEPRELGFYEDSRGVFWLFHGSGNGLAVYDRAAGTLIPYAFAPRDLPGLPLTGVSSMVEDGDGTLWIGTFSDGLLRFDRERRRFVRYRYDPSDELSLNENRVTTLAGDREGNVWVGFGATEPAFFATRRSPFRALPFDGANAANLGERLVNELFEDADGTLWVGTTGALARFDATTRQVRHFAIPGDGVASDVLAILRDRSGALWIGTSGQGLYRLDERAGELTAYRRIEGDPGSLSNDFVVDLYGDRADRLWIATLGGLNLLDPATGRFSLYQHIGDTEPVWYKSIAGDADGRLWLGSHGNGLVRFDPSAERFEVFGLGPAAHEKLSDLRINSIFVDGEGAVWAGTQNGLNRLDPRTGRVRSYFEEDGLASSAVSCMREDESGALWIGTSNGLSRLDRDRSGFGNYSRSDGLPGPDLTGWGACHRGPGGLMYFGGFAGAVVFEPGRVTEPDFLPPIVLTDFQLFGVSAGLGAGSPLTRSIGYVSQIALSHEQNSFTFEFSALSFGSPETNRYRYMLEGVDKTWREVGSHRRYATYTTLDPGAYRFRVQGATSRGRWNEPGLGLDVTIRPPWWATWWFRGVAIVGALALVWAAYAYRVRQISGEYDIRLEARVSERARIARELHDSLLQGFQGIMFRLQAVHNLLPGRAAEAAAALEAVMERGDEVVAEGREAVFDLRSVPHEERDLTAAMTALKADLEAIAGDPLPAYRVTVEGQPRPIAGEVRDEVYRIAREAFRNAAMHARAGNIEAEIGYLDEGLYLRVRDDGVGIDPGILERGRRGGHWGLQGMRERAEALPGFFTVWSRRGAGTEIELRVPAEVAFRGDASV